MSTFQLRKKNGEILEVEADEVLSFEDICELCGEQPDPQRNAMLEQLCCLVEAIKGQKQPPAPVVNVAPAPAPIVNIPNHGKPTVTPGFLIDVTERGKDGRVKAFRVTPIQSA